MNILHSTFNQNPPEEIVKEFPIGSGVKYISIRDIKSMMNEYFVRWSTSNFKVQFLQIGHDLLVSGSVELTVVMPITITNSTTQITELSGTDTFSFIGANTFNVKSEQAEGNNDNYEAILLSNCIKNAAKNLGVLFGYNLNTIDEYLPNYKQPKEAPKQKDKKVKSAIDNILKTQKTNS